MGLSLVSVQLSAHIEKISVSELYARFSLKNLVFERSFWVRQITILAKKIVTIPLLSKHVFKCLSFCTKQNNQPKNFLLPERVMFLNNNLTG